MKKKIFFLTAVAMLSLATATIAQNVPSYVPTNGLVGWWPFNGNANDESGNNNNGTVNGATLTSDRNGNVGKAYSFDGVNDFIISNGGNQFANQTQTVSFWINFNNVNSFTGTIIALGSSSSCLWGTYYNYLQPGIGNGTGIGCGGNFNGTNTLLTNNNWYNLIVVTNINLNSFFVNGNFIGNTTNSSGSGCSIDNLYFGVDIFSVAEYFNGKLDDIGIWNRALTQQEITNLYNSVSCNNNLVITPQNNVLQIGNTATFNATTSDANPNYIWQSDLGQGFQTLNNYGNYSGVNTNTLTVANVQLSEHNQAIRAISTSGNCVDTSNVAYIQIADTCITNVTVYDTVTTYISVTDTLFINVNTVGLNNNTIINTIKVFPNPANTNLNLDFGNFTNLNGYSIKIFNSLSQVIYNQAITQQSESIDLSTFGGNGIYFLHIINAQNNTVEIRKIVLQ